MDKKYLDSKKKEDCLMKVVHKSKISFMAILLVFAMLAGIFPVGVFAEEDLVLSSEAGINEEYNESEG